MQSNDLAVMGLGVMGHGLALNIARKGFSVAGYDRNTAQARAFVKNRVKDEKICSKDTLAELVAALKLPRRIFLMAPAGDPVDEILRQLKPLLTRGDIIIDCGNSHFADTQRRQKAFEACEISIVGMGVSGGEKGAQQARFQGTLRQALLAARIISYAQGINLLSEASNAYGYGFDMHRIVRVWRAGCILRSPFLSTIAGAFEGPQNLPAC